jgi:SAM-dependent methyltransferase
MMKLTKPLPPGRSFEQVTNHYLVEKSIAERLKKSTRAERKVLYASMYDELFRKVPDHPRLTQRQSAQLTASANVSKFSIVRKFLNESVIFAEFAPGDCRFAFEVATQVKSVYGIDISDQRNPTDIVPDNFKLIVYDGYYLDKIENNSIDIVFSDQLIEHIHPEDTKLHFELVHRILKVGGKYIFRTPHFLTGPHDVSQYFSYEPDCFHLKEWTYTEIKRVLLDVGYSKFHTHWSAKGINLRMPFSYFALCELVVGQIPKRYIRSATKYLIPHLCGVAIK